jgi:DNA-binding LytR/AlgR family response regulator
MMTCIIIEDQPPAQRILTKYIADTEDLALKATFPDALSALAFLETTAVDLIFLDMHLPKMSGFDFLKNLPQPPAVVLTTAFPDYALESYEFSVVDYLLKPFSLARFSTAVDKVRAKLASVSHSSGPTLREVFVKSGYELVKVQVQDIFFIKSDADYTEMVLERPLAERADSTASPTKKLLSAEPLRYWEETLAVAGFVRTHKSYIVNTARIEKIAGNQIFLPWRLVVPVGRAYRGRL